MKIALVSTPRSGNTWLRLMMGSAYGLHSTAVHDPFALDWQALPPRSIVQVHWAPEPRFIERVESAGFKVLTIARHPLDVLISILHFCGHEPQTSQWLLGDAGDEADIAFKAPTDPQFAAYACGARARALLQVSARWWAHQPAVMRVKYEDLVVDAVATLAALEPHLGPPQIGFADVAAGHSLKSLALTSSNQHFWQGRPGVWKQLIAPSVVRQILTEHAQIFSQLSYDADMLAEPSQADLERNWSEMN